MQERYFLTVRPKKIRSIQQQAPSPFFQTKVLYRFMKEKHSSHLFYAFNLPSEAIKSTRPYFLRNCSHLSNVKH